MLDFLWNNKRHRLSRKLMCTLRSQGGMGVPDLKLYYYAAHLKHLASWSTFGSYKCWTKLEKSWLAPVHPKSFGYTPEIHFILHLQSTKPRSSSSLVPRRCSWLLPSAGCPYSKQLTLGAPKQARPRAMALCVYLHMEPWLCPVPCISWLSHWLW